MTRRRPAAAPTVAKAFSRRERRILAGAVVVAVSASILMSLAAQKQAPDRSDPFNLVSADSATPAADAAGVSAN
jgi:hypothetical protein